MTQLSRLAGLGLGKESAPGTYAAPTIFIPFTKADWSDDITELKDESFRSNDSVLQGMYAGPISADWSIDFHAYPDLIGHFLRGMIGPDTVTAGAVTTLSALTAINATTISTPVAIAVGSYISIDTGPVLQEYAKVTATSGTGPYILTVTTSDTTAVGLTKAHAAAVPVVASSTHTFKQSINPALKATYSLTVYDTLTTLGYTDVVWSDFGIKIDPKASIMCSVKAKCLPGVSQSVMTPTYTSLTPLLGWEWIMQNAGAASTRGLSYDLSLKRAIDVIHSSDGTQGPREIFQGAITADGSYKALFENQTDLNLYANYLQLPASAVMQQPIAAGGASLALTMSKSGWYKGKREWGAAEVEASFSLSGIYNATDGGVVSAVLTNFLTAAY